MFYVKPRKRHRNMDNVTIWETDENILRNIPTEYSMNDLYNFEEYYFDFEPNSPVSF